MRLGGQPSKAITCRSGLGGQPSKAITCRTGLGGRQIDVVLSDMAPSNPGMASVNHDMTLQLVYSVLEVIPS